MLVGSGTTTISNGAPKDGCARCRQLKGTLNIRNEHLCIDCFRQYVGVKVMKRMESNKLRSHARDQPRVLLVALSMGASSLAMLHVLDESVQRQCRKTGRAGYNLQILYVDDSGCGSSRSSGGDTFSLIKRRYPSHDYTRLPLEDALDVISASSPGKPKLSVSHLHKVNECRDTVSKADELSTMLANTANSSRGETINILRQRLVASVAIHTEADAILYGDSTTKLAEKALSESARGKGAFVPWLTQDGPSPIGVPVFYPMRDLLRKELVAYGELTDPPLQPLVVLDSPSSAPASSKDLSIDSLMQQYFATVEEQYPSIVANVVRTSGKLITPQTGPKTRRCSLCALPISDGGDFEGNMGTDRNLCHGCSRVTIEPR